MSNESFTAADVLEAAADRIEQYGWCRGAEGMAGEACCTMGAITAAIDAVGNDPFRVNRFALRDKLAMYLGLSRYAIEIWNDEEGRTASEVISALRECAAGLREGGE